MKKHIYNEQNGLHYTLHGDDYLPLIWLCQKTSTSPLASMA